MYIKQYKLILRYIATYPIRFSYTQITFAAKKCRDGTSNHLLSAHPISRRIVCPIPARVMEGRKGEGRVCNLYTQRNLFGIILNQPEIRL